MTDQNVAVPRTASKLARAERSATREAQLAELERLGHHKLAPLEAIRARCLDCCAGVPSEVRHCAATRCPTWPFRLGTNPWRVPATDAQREASRSNAARLHQIKRRSCENHGLSGADATSGTPAPASASARETP